MKWNHEHLIRVSFCGGCLCFLCRFVCFSLSHTSSLSLFMHSLISMYCVAVVDWKTWKGPKIQHQSAYCVICFYFIFFCLWLICLCTILSISSTSAFPQVLASLSLSLYSLFIYFHLTPYVVKTKKKTTLITHTDSLSLFSQNSCTMSLKLTREFQDTM